jgi:hypothetical protein
MTITITISKLVSPVLEPTSVLNANVIQNAYDIRFYFRGGRDVICIKRNAPDNYTVHIPAVSLVKETEILAIIENKYKELTAELDLLKIPLDTYVLFDTIVCKIITPKDFIDYFNCYDTRRSLFVLINEDGSTENKIRYIADQTDIGLLQFAPLVIAKRELFRSSDWTQTGRRLLSYLVSSKYDIPGNFYQEYGCWANVSYKFNEKSPDTLSVDLSSFDLTRVKALAEGATDKLFSIVDGDVSIDKQGVLLSDLIKTGVSSLCKSALKPVIDVIIDVGKDVYNTIVIYTESETCYVSLNTGVSLTLEKIKENLQTDNIKLISYDDTEEMNYG